MKIHKLKIMPKYFEEISDKKKKFEIRKNDRCFEVGDLVVLNEYNDGKYTGRVITRRVTYIYYGTGEFGLEKGYCILGLSDD